MVSALHRALIRDTMQYSKSQSFLNGVKPITLKPPNITFGIKKT